MDNTTGNGGGFTVKEIVIEIRDTVKELANKVDRIDRQGSIGTREQLREHDNSIHDHEARLGVLENRPRVTREDLHEVKADIASLRLWQAGLVAIAGWKKWQLGIAIGVLGAVSGGAAAVITILLGG